VDLDDLILGEDLQKNCLNVCIHLKPRARADEIQGIHNGALKISLTAPPVENAANKALIKFLAEILKITKKDVSLKTGKNHRKKVLEISNINKKKFLERIKKNISNRNPYSKSSKP
jgi:hypothetical protein